MDYEKKYKQLHTLISDLYPFMSEYCKEKVEGFLPELKKSEDEKIIDAIKHGLKCLGWEHINGIRIVDIIDWLEKQDNESVNIDIESMVSSYEQRVVSQCNGVKNNPFVNMCVSAFRHGIENTLEELNLMKLEKQGEKPPGKTALEAIKEEKVDNANKIETNFKVGDWILYSGDHYEGVRHITKIDENGYYIERNGLPHGIIPFNHEICMRLWNIQDAKDGDVLAEDSCIFIIERMKSNETAIVHCCLFDDGDFDLGSTLGFDVDSTYPATKEQRATLFAKMKDTGYEWDAKKKELKKIDARENLTLDGDLMQADCMIVEQKSSWTKEDDVRLQRIIDFLWRNRKGDTDTIYQQEQDVDWLKSLKQRIGG